MSHDPADAVLLAASAGGDRAAFDRWVNRHVDAAWRYARTVARDDASAEDAVQEGFLAAWRHAGEFGRRGPRKRPSDGRGGCSAEPMEEPQGDASARGWLFTIVRRAAFRQGRRRAGQPAAFDDLAELAVAAGWGAPDEVLEHADDARFVHRVLDALEPEAGEVLLLADLEGLPNAEVAEVLGLSLAATKSRLHRARLAFVAAARRIDRGGSHAG